MYRPFIKNIALEKSRKLINVGHFLFQKQESFFARMVFWSGSKMCALTSIPLWKYVINLTNTSSNICCPFSKGWRFFNHLNWFCSISHDFFCLVVHITLWPPSIPWISWNILLLNWKHSRWNLLGWWGYF